MTEPRRDWPAGLPLGPDAPVFTAPAPDALLQRGRHARRMHAAVAAASVVALMAVGSAVAVNASAHRADRLRVVTPAVNRTPAPHVSAPTAHQPGTHDTATVASGATQTSGQAPALAPSTIVQPTPASDSAATAVPASLPTASRFRRTTLTNPPATSCAYQPMSAPSGWCIDNPSPASAQSGVPVNLAVEVCRIQGLGTGTLHFGNAEEADIGIWGRTDAQSWQWSHGRHFAARAHTVSVRAGQCLRWTTRWTTRANDGSPLPRGTYSIQVSVASPDVDLPNSVTGTATDFTLT